MRIAELALALLTFASAWAADLPTPTTTLTAETSNNTSAAPAFLAQPNGNQAGANVSKIPTRSLLYPGSTTKIYAHVEPWWGSSHHIDIGYSSQDPAQVRRQVMDMISRGLDGAVADWYGPDSYEALGVKLLMAEAETHSGFGFFVEIDKGAIEWDSCYPGCNATTAAIQLVNRVAGDFYSSPAYFRIGGRPVLREFGMETISFPSGQSDPNWNVVDWNAVQSQVPGNPLIIHRNLGGFAKARSGGAFTWMEPKTLDVMPANYDGTDELDWFYSNAIASYGSMPAVGAVWKGFNDILADWAPPGGRHIEQNCGQSWLRTFAAANRYYSAARQLPVLQLVTWNDYEEGTELETGIDNCVTVSASVSGSTLRWSITGDESTLDHYVAFISSDGENLAVLGNFAAGNNAVDLAAFAIPAGSYSLFVKAVGKPSLRNQMSAPVTLTVAPPPPPPPPPPQVVKDVIITATPSSLQVTRGQPGQLTLTVAQTGATDLVSLSCSNLPSGATCSFAPSALTPGVQPMPVVLTIATSGMSATLRNRRPPLFALWMPAAMGLVMLPGMRRRHRRTALFALLLGLVLLQLACGGGQTRSAVAQSAASPNTPANTTPASPPNATPPSPPSTPTNASTYTIIVTATSGSVTRSTNVTLTVN
jgi:hypothetical protein